METEKPSSLRALGLGLIFVGITIVMIAGMLLLLSLFLSPDRVFDITPPGMEIEDNPFYYIIQLTPLWAIIVIYGLIYIYAATRFREFESWSYWTIIIMSALLPIIEILSIVLMVSSSSFEIGTVGVFFIPSFLGTAVPAGILVWYLLRPSVKHYFINS